MPKLMRRLAPQPLTAFVMCLLAAAALAQASAAGPRLELNAASVQAALLGLALAAGVAVAGVYPIHIQYRTKVLLTTPPLYLAAVLLPVPLGALAAGLGVLAVQLLTRRKKGSLPSDIATAVSRWVLVTCLGAWVAHLPADNPWTLALTLGGAALVLFVGDVVTTAFEIAPMAGEPTLHVMAAAFQAAGLIELAQYLLGILGALAAREAVWALALMVVP